MNLSHQFHGLLTAATLAAAALTASQPAQAALTADQMHQALLGTWTGERTGGNPGIDTLRLEFTQGTATAIYAMPDGTPRESSYPDWSVKLGQQAGFRIHPLRIGGTMNDAGDQISIVFARRNFQLKRVGGARGPVAAGGGLQSQWAAAQAKLRAAGKPLNFANMKPLLPAGLTAALEEGADRWTAKGCDPEAIRLRLGGGYFQRHDCECARTAFLDARVATPTWHEMDRSGVTLANFEPNSKGAKAVFDSILHQCADEDLLKQNLHENCKRFYARREPEKYRKFCGCAAHKFAKLYLDSAARTKQLPGYRGVQQEAYSACNAYRP